MRENEGTQMLEIAICDDDELLCEDLCNAITKQMGINNTVNIDKYLSGTELLKSCQKNQYDAIFLDIHIKEENGFAVADVLWKRSYSTNLIFITSDNALVYQSFDYNPFYFLRKDDYKEVLPKVVEKLINSMKQNIYFEVENSGEIKNLMRHEIYYLESDRHKVAVYTKKYTYSARKKISDLEQRLAEFDFVRIQRGYLVNLKHVTRINLIREEIELKNDTVLKMSRRNKTMVEQAFRIYQRKLMLYEYRKQYRDYIDWCNAVGVCS